MGQAGGQGWSESKMTKHVEDIDLWIAIIGSEPGFP